MLKTLVGLKSYIPDERDNGGRPAEDMGMHANFKTQNGPIGGFGMEPLEVNYSFQNQNNNCKTPSCQMFGTPERGGYCSGCANKNVVERDGGLT